jgi:hypothetical protein
LHCPEIDKLDTLLPPGLRAGNITVIIQGKATGDRCTMKWLANIPYMLLVPLALFLALAPFTPEPHLWEKLKLLFAGTLVRPIDIFDLLLHGTPLVLLLLKLSLDARRKL